MPSTTCSIARISLLVAAVLSLLATSSAFSVSSPSAPVRVHRRANSSTRSSASSSFPLRMSAEDEAERLRAQAAKLREEVAEATGKSVAEVEAEAEATSKAVQVQQVNADGTVYDDETPEYRDPLSDSMRERLRREASTGLDSNQKQTNVILYISIAVAVLVLLGGQGILY